MVDESTIEAPPEVDEQNQPQQPPSSGGGEKLRLLHIAVGKEYNLGSFEEFKQKMQDPSKRKQFYDAVGKQYNLGKYDEFESKISGSAPQVAITTPTLEHEIVHNSIQDIRHIQEMANKPVQANTVAIDPMSGGGANTFQIDPKAEAESKIYKAQYDKLSADLASQWGAKPETVKQVLSDFPDEQDENRLKGFATLAKENPVNYGRLKNANDIRSLIVKSNIQPGSIDPDLLTTRLGQPSHENSSTGLANAFNDLNQETDFNDLESKVPFQQQMMRQAGLSQNAFDKLKEVQRPFINSLDVGLLQKHWNGPDKELGLSEDEYAGLETERLFNPNKAQLDLSILKHSRGVGADGKANPLDMSKESYEYQRGVENVRYNLQKVGRENKDRFVAENKGTVDKQVDALKEDYQNKVNNAASPQEQQALIEEFSNHPLVQEANKLEDAQQDLQYSVNDDQRRYPLNFADQATREVQEAMDHTSGFWGNTAKLGGNVLQGAGESADNTIRWIKNTAINLVANDQYAAFNAAKNIGHQSLTELSAFQPTSYTGQESPLNVPRGTIDAVQAIFKDPEYKTDAEREQHAIAYLRNNWDQLTVNPKAGQQNMTGKASLFQAANVMGQILGIADQSFLLGGAIGDASKLQQMASAFTPMYMSTQNQMYEKALKNGDEHPLLKSNIDAAIISLASLINPDLKVVKGMVGAESGVGKLISGIDESTWAKVLSENKPLVDRTIAAAKATGRQLGLANLQYGVIAPTAEFIAHKSILHEDANLGDMIKDGVIQTSITMALPSLLHGVWGGIRATEVNPQQKYAIVEAGLHPDQQIDLIESKIKAGQIPEIQGHEMKQLIKHAGEILQNTEMVKTDGTPMNENEVADVTYNMLRKQVLENKMKTAAEPVKPIIEDKIHEINKDISDLHTSDSDKHLNELNQMLHDNMDKIVKVKPEYEQTIKEAIAENRPQDVFWAIANQIKTKEVDGKETTNRPEVEEIFGKKLVDKALELQKQKPEANEKTGNAEAQTEGEVSEKPTEGAVSSEGATVAAPSIPEIKTEDHAIQIGSPSSVLQHPQEGTGSERGERGGMEPSEQGEGTPQESDSPQTREGGSEVPPKEVDSNALPFGPFDVGISHEAQIDRAKAELNIAPPERGEGVTMEEAIQRGRDLIANGTDPDKVLADFQKTGKISMEDISVVRAKYDQLAKATNEAYDKFGENSPEGKIAMKAERDWYNTAVKPMQTEWSKAGMAQQGRTDLDTGSVMAMKRAVKEKFDKDMTPTQVEKAKEIVEKNKQLDKQVKDLQSKLDKLHSEPASKIGTFTEKTKKAADAFRKLKTKEFTFKDSNGNDVPIQKMGVGWNELVELGAKAIEKSGQIADGIAAILENVKEADWYKSLSGDDKNRFEKELEDHYTSVADKKTASRIKALEKQLADLKEGKVKEKGAKRELTEREKELQDQIFEEKNKMGLIKPKAVPKAPKTPIKEQPIAERFVGKKDEVFTPEEAKLIWQYTKDKYLDKGKEFPEALKNVATDLGLNRKQILAAIATPKGAKEVTLEMYKKQYERTKALNSAKTFIETANNSKAKNFWNQLPSVFFNLKTYGHGTVGFITHAGPNIFRPSVWKSYWPNFFKQFSFAYGNLGKYEQALDGLKESPRFDEWKRSGLAVDPNEAYDQYQLFGIKQSWLGAAGTRGFNALKFLRYDMAEQFYNSSSDAEKADPALREHIAELVNHATGHTEVKVPGKLAKVFFAPGLEISRWQRMITDPAQAVKTVANWSKSTPAEQAAAKIVFRGAGEKLATYSALLAANAGMLSALGSKQKLNLTDPSKSDWLKFKAGDKTMDFTGGVLNPIRLLSVVLNEARLSVVGDKQDLRTKPGDKDASTITSQLRYKLSPIAGAGADLLTGTDAMGNPFPWSKVPPGKGRHQIGWGEFITQQMPIPIAAGVEAAMEGMRERGMPEPQINDVLNGILQFGVEGFTGAKVSPDFSLENKGGTTGGAGARGSFGNGSTRTPRK